ncbi:MAG: FtsQ-type POTRA domain-containing protein [Cyanobacteria bacterium]|nr:FtsQ-type POTRA domain-containing protein [Cyanobacteriota bacterium]MDW8202373.1 FtsQ-type POTRA domain-containing protein [Cyanobacteriota bacterium SKYGB_h_bin112]
MVDISSVSEAELRDRRAQLRRRRQIKSFQSIWRLFAITGAAVGMGWVMTHTDWVIYKPEQIQVNGNQRLSATTVRSILALSYPQSILALDPKALTDQLETSAHISRAIVVRTLFPPRLVVHITERHPVAIVSPKPISIQQLTQAQQRSSLPPSIGLIDDQGNFMPLRDYSLSQQTLEGLDLQVIGMDPSQYPDWKFLYPLIRDSIVPISELDWQNPANLVLKTSLGTVYIGSYGDRFPTQLQALAQMRQIVNRVKPSQIAYIDLRDPTSPTLELRR